MARILLTHTPEARANYYGERALAGLRALGEVRLHTGPEPLSADGLVSAATDCDVIVCDRATPGLASVFERLPRLVACVRCAVDIRTIDVGAASRAGVLVTRASPGFVPAVAELVFGMMVDLARGVTRATIDYRGGATPAAIMGTQLAGATLGVLGYGAIGARVAALGAAFGMRVLVCDPFVTASAPGIEQATFQAVLAQSDFVVCLVVANEQTESLLNRGAFAQMKRGAFFVNVSRGNLIDEAALAQALDSGHLAGAALDVGRAPDQMPSLALARRAEVIATPHIGGLTPQAIAHQALETVSQVAKILAGEVPAGAVNASDARRLAPQRGC